MDAGPETCDSWSVPDRRTERGPLLTLGVGLLLTGPLLLWFGSHWWFIADEWDFLSQRGIGDAFEPYQGHWVALPVVAFRINFSLWGLHHYLPYQVLTVIANGVLVLLLWLLMRRMGVGRWLATGLSLPLMVFGSGAVNLLYAFQITLVGSLAFGLAHILLALHDGPFGKRDWLGLLLGFLGLMCSAVAVSLVVGLAVGLLLARGWRVAAFHTAPLAAVYLIWVQLAGSGRRERTYRFDLDLLEWPWAMATATLVDLADNRVLAAVLALLVLAGVGAVARVGLRLGRWAPAAIPAALLVSLLVFAMTTAIASPDGTAVSVAGASKSVHIAAVLLLPLIAFGSSAIARLHPRLALAGIVPVAVIAVGLPRNLDRLGVDIPELIQSDRDLLVAVSQSELLDNADPERRIVLNPLIPDLAPTVDWVIRNRDRIPDDTPSRESELTARGLLALDQHATGDAADCPPFDDEWVGQLAIGDIMRLNGVIEVVVVDDAVSRPVDFDSSDGATVSTRFGPIEVRVVPGGGGSATRFCAPR